MGSLVRHRRLGPLLLVIALALVAIGCPTSETVDDEDARGDASVGGGDADRTSDAHNTPNSTPRCLPSRESKAYTLFRPFVAY